MTSRFYCPLPLVANSEIALPAEAAHHAEKVLRLRTGDAVNVFDGQGREFAACISASGREVRVQLGEQIMIERESPLLVTLVQALAVADKMDWIVQKAVELGAVAVQPITTERCVLRLEGERAAKRVSHWQQIAISAAEQSGRNTLTMVHGISGLVQWLARRGDMACWVLHPEGATALGKMPRPSGPLALLIGPEGGWSPAELATLRAAGCQSVSMGPRVLRTETAGLATLAAMNALWGDF